MNLLDYIKGRRHGREAQRIELEAMRDQLLRDAIDGYEAVPGDHTEVLERLNAQIIQRTSAGGRKARAARERRLRNWSVAAAAVVIAAGIGGGAWLLRNESETGQVFTHGIGNGNANETPLDAILPPVKVIPNDTLPDDDGREDVMARMAGRSRAVQTDKAQDIQEEIYSDYINVISEPLIEVQESEIPADFEMKDTGFDFPEYQVSDRKAASGVDAAEPEHSEAVQEFDDTSLDEVVAVGYGTRKKRVTVMSREFREYLAERVAMTDIAGNVVLEFEVDAEGRPYRIKVVESTSKEAGRAARRLLREGPGWPPDAGKQRVDIEFGQSDK